VCHTWVLVLESISPEVLADQPLRPSDHLVLCTLYFEHRFPQARSPRTGTQAVPFCLSVFEFPSPAGPILQHCPERPCATPVLTLILRRKLTLGSLRSALCFFLIRKINTSAIICSERWSSSCLNLQGHSWPSLSPTF
jgi:hypothetical protein